MENLQYALFSDININDSFFDSLKEDYSEFSGWFTRKALAGEKAYVLYRENTIDGFMYLKTEEEIVDDVDPPLPYGTHLKIGTFKFNSQGTRRGERFIKKIFDHAIEENVSDIYVTIFSKHEYLMHLFMKYGFSIHGSKETPNGTEHVLTRKMGSITGNTLHDYPYINTIDNRKHLLAIKPEYHTRMLPDSILNNETHNIIKDVSHTNSIHKIYICAMDGVTLYKKGDLIVIYRTSDGLGPAKFRSVATSIGILEEYKNIQEFSSESEFLSYCSPYSVFSNEELISIFRQQQFHHILRFTYNAAMSKRVTRGTLIEDAGLNPNSYWGSMELSDEQFGKITKLGEVNESIIVN
ncbi:hypothetical protein ACJJIK_17095 [Microbulbifer sp. ZKSA006]|uniref:hypothetical protein n=1 Tax=Microbulbifer sp. ZKSA006 TaxID=3243390 RepID=UPI0040397893